MEELFRAAQTNERDIDIGGFDSEFILDYFPYDAPSA
jgi:hypothetical protein